MTLENASIAIFITLENPTKDMIATAKKAEFYQHKYFTQTYDKMALLGLRGLMYNEAQR